MFPQWQHRLSSCVLIPVWCLDRVSRSQSWPQTCSIVELPELVILRSLALRDQGDRHGTPHLIHVVLEMGPGLWAPLSRPATNYVVFPSPSVVKQLGSVSTLLTSMDSPTVQSDRGGINTSAHLRLPPAPPLLAILVKGTNKKPQTLPAQNFIIPRTCFYSLPLFFILW